jgi:hypothetical protein
LRLPLAACLVLAASVNAQPRLRDSNVHGWFFYSGDHPVSQRFGIHFDGQWRRHNVISRWQQYQLRPGVNWSVNDSVMLTLGYAYTRTYPYGDNPADRAFPEHRIYQQALLRHTVGRVGMSHRYRLEQRFIGEYPDAGQNRVGAWRRQQRFRYAIKGAVPLTEKRMDGNTTWYVPISNEFLLNFGANYGASAFDQNRTFGGVGYNFGRRGQLEAGYLYQLLAQRNGRILELNHTLVVSFTSTLRIRK